MIRGMYGSIVVGTDGSDTAKEAVRQAERQSLMPLKILQDAGSPFER